MKNKKNAIDEAEQSGYKPLTKRSSRDIKNPTLFGQFPEHFSGNFRNIFSVKKIHFLCDQKNTVKILRFDLIYMWLRFLVTKLLNIVPALAPLFLVRKHDRDIWFDFLLTNLMNIIQ